MPDVDPTEVYNGPLRNASGRPLHRVPIPVAAVVPLNPFLRDGRGSVISRTVADTDRDGIWRTQLVPSSFFERADAYYVADERKAGGELVMFTVPNSGGPYRVRDLLIQAPPTGGEAIVEYTRWWSGLGPPPEVIIGAKPGDIYVEDRTGTIYQLT